MKISILLVITVVLAGCVSFHPRSLSSSQVASAFEARKLDNLGLKKFLEENLHHKITPWPPKSWDFPMLALVSLYYHPDLDVARAQWEVARTGVITAGGRLNPSIGFVPGYVTNAANGVSPWILGLTLDVPVETAGKRDYRIAQARYITEVARLNITTAAWQVRSRVRASLHNLYRANQRQVLLRKQKAVQEEIVKLLEQRLAFGEVAQPDVTLSHISFDQFCLSLRDEQIQLAESRGQLASALGLPVSTLNGANISFDFVNRLPLSSNLPAQELRRQALFNRPDILATLAEYAASQAALQLEIVKQYPNIHLGPGYTFDQGDNQWAFGFSVSLPVFNRNQGPIAEAEARRKATEARFAALQARVIGEIDRAFAAYRAALQKLETADSLLAARKKQVQSVQAMFNVGEADRLAFLSAQLELGASALARLDALITAQQALGLLEDTVQRPLDSLGSLPVVSEPNPRAREAMDK